MLHYSPFLPTESLSAHPQTLIYCSSQAWEQPTMQMQPHSWTIPEFYCNIINLQSCTFCGPQGINLTKDHGKEQAGEDRQNQAFPPLQTPVAWT